MQTLAILSGSPLFQMLADQELEAIAALCAPRQYLAGALIFEEGELGDSLYVIVRGEVDVLQQGVAIVTLGPPEFFGEMGLIDKEYRSATVRAKVDSELLRLSSENLTQFRQRHPDGFTFIVMNIARMLSSRLREANLRLGPLPGKGPL
jgi:CRP/FNR family transcriptional regulator, cyclic AMP receptor protein